jgi:hypothetical protein
MANPKNGQVPKVQRGGEKVWLQLSNDGQRVLITSESYRLGAVSTVNVSEK